MQDGVGSAGKRIRLFPGAGGSFFRLSYCDTVGRLGTDLFVLWGFYFYSAQGATLFCVRLSVHCLLYLVYLYFSSCLILLLQGFTTC